MRRIFGSVLGVLLVGTVFLVGQQLQQQSITFSINPVSPSTPPTTGTIQLDYNNGNPRFVQIFNGGSASQLGGSVDTNTITTGASGQTITVTGTGYWYNNSSSASAITYNLPTITITAASSPQRNCFLNYPGVTGAITLQAPASTYIVWQGTLGNPAGKFVSAGALGDTVCTLAIDTTHYIAQVGSGSWSQQ